MREGINIVHGIISLSAQPPKKGYLKEIYHILIAPFMKVCPDSMNAQNFLDTIWDVDKRDIKRYTVKIAVVFKGKRRVFWNQWIKTELKLLPFQEVWLRTDKNAPEMVDVEVVDQTNYAESKEYQIDFVEASRLLQFLKEKKKSR